MKCVLCRTGYDPFIDFLKGICIILIILTHCVPFEIRLVIGFPIWGSPAVPIFLIIQVFHFYKNKKVLPVQNYYYKIWCRVFRPFIFVESIILLLWVYNYYRNNALTPPSFMTLFYILSGGPGTYYPWIYLQFAILLPICRSLFNHSNIYSLIIFLLLSQFAEILCSISAMPEWLYRLTFFRYFFLLYLGYLLANKGYIFKGKTMMLSIISIASVFFFAYISVDTTPLFYNVEAWASCHWICYIYISFLMIVGLNRLHSCIHDYSFSTLIRLIGKYSYEIFLLQLFYFTCISDYVNCFIEDKYFVIPVLSVLFCIIPVLVYKEWKRITSYFHLKILKG